jgi:ABC-type cobalt transport system substrate-binding protein
MAVKQKKETEKEKNLRETAVSEMIRLMTASFGLIAALAWNQVIQELVKNYIQPIFGKDSGLISLLIYALVVTILAVTITYFVSRFVKKD